MRRETAMNASARPDGHANPDGFSAHMTFKATFRWVRRAVHETMEALEETGMHAEDLGTIEIVLAEALNNIVEHAYPGDAPGDIDMTIRTRRSGIMVEIKDRGTPMPNGRAPMGNHPLAEYNDDPMPEGGYGWYLIRELVQDLVYDRKNGENCLIFRVSYGQRAGT